MLPFVDIHTRLILVNRRDYPGSQKISATERSLLVSADSSDPTAAEAINAYMKDRAQDYHDFLETLVTTEEIPVNSVIIAGWSFGSTFILALLAHGVSLSSKNTDCTLSRYIKRAVIYGTSGCDHIALPHI